MSMTQTKILMTAPKALYCYTYKAGQKWLIPDTARAKERAIELGAKEWDALLFHRLDENRRPSPWRIGDFSCRIKLLPSFSQTGLCRIVEYIERCLLENAGLSNVDCARFIYVNSRSLDMTLPLFSFSLPYASLFRRYYYIALVEHMKALANAFHFDDVDISYSGRLTAPNTKTLDRRYAISINLQDLLSQRHNLIGAAEIHRYSTCISRNGFIDSEICGSLLTRAKSLHEAHTASSCARLEWNARGTHCPFRPLISEDGAVSCGPNTSARAVKCAIKLTGWLQRDGIVEFRRRDALRAVDGSFTLDTGVDEALRLMTAHGYLIQCPLPTYSFGGRPPSPWYVVNPAVFVSGAK